MIAEVALFGIVIVFLFVYLASKPKGLPPGEWGVPLLGYIPKQDKPFMHYVEEYRKKFGDIFVWKMGNRNFVFLCNFNLIKTAFNNPALVDRPDFYSILNFALGRFLGIKESNGASWQNVRRFSVRYLRDRGMGKSSIVPEIENEVIHLVEEFKKDTINKPTEIPWSLNVAVLNVTWQMVANKRFDCSDRECQRFQRLITDMFDVFQGYMILIDLMPWLGKVMPKFVKKWLGINVYHDSVEEMYDFLREVVKESKLNKDPDRIPTIVDAYLAEINKGSASEFPTFTEDDLLVTLGDLFTAGSDTTSSTIRWILLYLAKYPEVQKKLQEELDANVPKDRYPSLEDREKLPYTNAVFHEVLRVMPLLPISFYHSAAQDTNINEYKIPKGTVIIGSIISCHMDPKHWKKPKEFYPEHFLNEDGSFNGKHDGFLPFSIGRRSCIGESLARMQVYLMSSALLQQFNVLPVEGEELSLKVDPKQPLFNLPIKFRVIFTERT